MGVFLPKTKNITGHNFEFGAKYKNDYSKI
jgi:hypothetical protein